MNRDYSKLLELQNQDAEKERNEKAEKAVHDNLYNKGFRDGIAILDKIRAEIVDLGQRTMNDNRASGIWACRDIIDKYKAESEDT